MRRLAELARHAVRLRGTTTGDRLAMRVLAFSDKSYCLMWKCGGNDNDLHVTHKYLGEIGDDLADRVIQTIDAYFRELQPIVTSKWVFDKPAWFGKDLDEHVRPEKLIHC